MMKYYKYPRTFHIPDSPGLTGDDKVMTSMKQFIGKEIVILEKRDGENTSLYPDGKIHARSIDSSSHPWMSLLKQEWGNKCYLLGERHRICGENLYAKHSIFYQDLTTFFEVFAIFKEDEYCVSWDVIERTCKELDLKTVPVLWRGMYGSDDYELTIRLLKTRIKNNTYFNNHDNIEGYVIRVVDRIPYNQYSDYICKYVRPEHVQTDKHWTKTWIPNRLKGKSYE